MLSILIFYDIKIRVENIEISQDLRKNMACLKSSHAAVCNYLNLMMKICFVSVKGLEPGNPLDEHARKGKEITDAH